MNPSNCPKNREIVKNAQRFIYDVCLHSEFNYFPFLSNEEQFFFALQKSSKINANSFNNLILDKASINHDILNNNEKDIIKSIELENGMQIQF